MSTETLLLLIATGSSKRHEPERMVSRIRQAITLDLVARVLTVPALAPVMAATNAPDQTPGPRGRGPAGRAIPQQTWLPMCPSTSRPKLCEGELLPNRGVG